MSHKKELPICLKLLFKEGFAFFCILACLFSLATKSSGFVYDKNPSNFLIKNENLFPIRLARPNTLAGMISGGQTPAPGNVNLTTEGTADWAHWGLSDAGSFNHKSGVTQQISNIIPVGGGTPQQYTESPTAFNWSGGTPIGTASNVLNGVFIIGTGNGFQMTVPADPTQRTLKLYVGVWAATGRLEASLSDGSAPTYIDTGLSNTSDTSNAVYTLNYQAASGGQTLTVKWTVGTAHNTWGNVTLQAASLVSQTVADNSAPTVSINGLRHYARVSNQVPVTVQAADNLGISRVELYADGMLLSTTNVSNVPNTQVAFNWNTTTLPNGKHTFQARAFDSSGNSQTVTFVVVSNNFTITPPPPGNRITILPNVSYQTFTGWQASGDTGIIELIKSVDNWNNTVLDANIDLGINRVRVGLHSGIAENPTNYYGTFLAGGQDAPNPLWQAVLDNWRVPVNDNPDPNTINPAGFKWEMVDRQIDKVVLPMRQKLQARGESLFVQLTYVHFSTQNQLHIENPAEYGELILATWNHINSKYGFVPDALEIFLEPDNDAASVTPSEMAAMIIAARNRLVTAGYPKPYITAPSTVSGPQARPFYLSLKSANPTAASYIDEIGYHRYVNISDSDLLLLRNQAESDGKKTAMSEFGGATYLDLHSDLKTGKVSVWEQYALGFPETDNGFQYFYVTGSNPNYIVNMGSRTKYLRQYMKFIRPGAVMKGVTNSSPAFDGLPFQNANGTFVIPIKATTNGTISVENLPAGTYGIKYTTDANYNVDLPNQTIVTGGFVTFNMSAAGVATVYNINYQTPLSSFTKASSGK